ncbi:MAG TPA: ATP-binding protein [Acidimicrobiales bacterium]|nr:ATP-binding protein [Acidimicrobiales bacterium]
MTLRLRLLLVLLGIMGVGLVAADVATYASLRSYLFSQVDSQLQDDAIPIGTQVADALNRPFGRARVVPPPGLWVQVRDRSGNVYGAEEAYPLAPPALPLQLPGSGSASSTSVLFNAQSGGSSPVEYRVLAEPLDIGGGASGTVVVAIPLNDLHHTLDRLVLIEMLVSAAVLVGLGAVAWWVVRRGLRPLDEMTATAGAIAAGDLSQRVEAADAHTEVGQLGQALNTMLSGIEGAFAARAASEDRLRRFLADASHELRTPLTSIRGYAELFDRGARDRPEDLATSMRHIREEANRMSVLVDDLLLLARLDRQRPLTLEPVDLADVVRRAVDAARVSAPERTVSLEVTGAGTVLGDADRLRQVADNLLANAVQHTPAGTAIDVRLHGDGAQVRLEVTDHGPGVPPGEQANIFEPFRRADPMRARATGGAGLGLTIVSAIAHAHRGTAGVASPVTDDAGAPGATFWVRIPVAGTAPPGDDGARGARRDDAAPGDRGADEPGPADGGPAGAGDQTLAMDANRV